MYSARRLDVGAGLWYNGDSRVAKGEVVYADTASGQPGNRALPSLGDGVALGPHKTGEATGA